MSQLIDSVDGKVSFEDLGNAAKANMKENYTWEKIVGEYEELFLYHESNYSHVYL